MNKNCIKCKCEKSINDFWKDKRHKSGISNICKQCQAQANKNSQLKNYGNLYLYHTNWRKKQTIEGNAKLVYAKKKHNAKQNNVEFSITIEDFIKLYCVDKKCYYCGISENKIKENMNMMPSTNKGVITLDRKDNTKGYIKDNIALCCSRCNLIKSNFFSEKEMLLIGKKYVSKKWN
jgi:hypothetical protein